MLICDTIDGQVTVEIECDICGKKCPNEEYEYIDGKYYCEDCLRENVNSL